MSLNSLSDDDALNVLDFVAAEHNADIGINWDVIYCAIETLTERNHITLLHLLC